jgi:two-component system chemotaxis sensor kinase CheA
MLIVSELVLTRNQLLQISRGQKDSEFSAPIQRLGHITSELQEKVMKTRMQPISNAWAPFPRLVRDLASELGKKINLKMIGEDTELDRQLIDAIKDPLTHMVRNSADHGLETPDVRVKSGKGEVGTITLNAYHQGGHIIIEISDDGRGLDEEKLKAKILKENLATEEEVAVMSKEQVYRYIFKAGFSTAAKVTSVSGRGVGMDVVDTNIKKINGHIDLNTKLGKGTSFFIKIPLTLAIMPVLIVECNKEKFAIPQINVLELVRTVESSGYVIENINQRPVLRLRNALLPLAHLAEILGFNTHENLMNVTENDVIVCKIGGYHFGIIVDRVYDTEEIVVKPVAPVLKSIDIYSGITLLGDGSVIMILDPNGIMKWLANTSEDNTFSNNEEHEQNSQEEKTTKFLLVKAGNVTKAIPLELVDRIEEIDVNNIEHSGEKQIIQYRDKLMYLSKLCDEDALKSDTKQPVVSFTDEEKILGIMVEEIIDIVEHKLEIISCLSNQGALGSMVINDKTTDIVDVAYYFTSVFGKNLIEPKALVSKAPPRILMIDDSLFFRKIIPEVLLKKGYDVIGTESGAKGLEILEKDRNFIGMIVDYNMSGINGLEFADLCQSNPMLQNIPLIILSAAHEFNQQKNHPNIKAFVSKNNHEHLIKMIEECFILNSAIVEKV